MNLIVIVSIFLFGHIFEITTSSHNSVNNELINVEFDDTYIKNYKSKNVNKTNITTKSRNRYNASSVDMISSDSNRININNDLIEKREKHKQNQRRKKNKKRLDLRNKLSNTNNTNENLTNKINEITEISDYNNNNDNNKNKVNNNFLNNKQKKSKKQRKHNDLNVESIRNNDGNIEYNINGNGNGILHSLKMDEQYSNNINKTEKFKKSNKQNLSRLKKLRKKDEEKRKEEKLLYREEKRRLREEKKALREKKRLERLLNGNNRELKFKNNQNNLNSNHHHSSSQSPINNKIVESSKSIEFVTEMTTMISTTTITITTTTPSTIYDNYKNKKINEIYDDNSEEKNFSNSEKEEIDLKTISTHKSTDENKINNDKYLTRSNKFIIGDFSCIKNGFISAPNIKNADIKYLRNDENGLENSYLEAKYICRSGYRLLNPINEDSSKLVCKNFNWHGELPECIIETKMITSSTNDCIDNGNCNQNCYHNKTTGEDVCVCYKGFELKENKCVDINECERDEILCEFGCINTIGSFRCKCPKGLRLNHFNKCVDVNECILRNGHGLCQDKCINTWGGYKCSCERPGTQLANDKHTCEETDECSINNGGCSHTCLSTVGQVFCICPDGWILDDDWKTCVDIDECANPDDLPKDDRCDFGCINTIGSYKCINEIGADQPFIEEIKTCNSGYTFNTTTGYCEDINECSINNGGCHHRCINTVGNFDCICKAGYVYGPDKQTCILSNATTDVACPPLFPPRHGYLECSRPIGQRIVNRPGSQCILRCPNGYRVIGRFSKTCGLDGKWQGEGGGTCIRYPMPKLMCPNNIYAELPPFENTVKINIPQPRTDVNLDRDVTYDPHWLKNSHIFEIGKLNVTVTAKNPISRLKTSCSYTINVLEGNPPKVVYCPETQHYSLKRFNENIKISWTEPIFTDNTNITEISRTNVPGNYFSVGSHRIVYEAKDTAGYTNKCVFKIIVSPPKLNRHRLHLPLY